MKVKSICIKMERIFKEKFPEIPITEVYYAKRRKHIHFAFEDRLFNFERRKEFLEELEKFFNEHLKNDFELLSPMKIIHTIKWKFDYIVFRKRKNPN